MLNIKELQGAKHLVNSLELEIGDFERSILIPQLRGRLEYVVTNCERLIAIAARHGASKEFDSLLLSVLPEGAVAERVEGIGENYLTNISTQLRQMIDEINSLLTKFPASETVNSKTNAVFFVNRAAAAFRPYVDLRESLFKYDFRNTLVKTDRQTGEVVDAEPKHITVILSAFDITLNELETVARSSLDSIDSWATQMREQQARNADFVLNFAALKTSERQERANKYILWFQIAVIVFAAMSIALGNWADLAINNHRLEQEIDRLQTRVDELEAAKPISPPAIKTRSDQK